MPAPGDIYPLPSGWISLEKRRPNLWTRNNGVKALLDLHDDRVKATYYQFEHTSPVRKVWGPSPPRHATHAPSRMDETLEEAVDFLVLCPIDTIPYIGLIPSDTRPPGEGFMSNHPRFYSRPSNNRLLASRLGHAIRCTIAAVSYTHLTLPTILLV